MSVVRDLAELVREMISAAKWPPIAVGSPSISGSSYPVAADQMRPARITHREIKQSQLVATTGLRGCFDSWQARRPACTAGLTPAPRAVRAGCVTLSNDTSMEREPARRRSGRRFSGRLWPEAYPDSAPTRSLVACIS